MTRLIDADELKKSTCDKGVCSDCEDFHKGNNVSTNCSEVRWYFLEKINEQPTVDAIPVEWLSKLADECAKDEDPYVQINGLLINVVINRWEQRTGGEHEAD